MSVSSFFGTLWRDVQVGVRLLTPYEPVLSALPGGQIAVTVLNVLTALGKVIPTSSDATKASLAAALTIANHPTVDPKALEASILELLGSSAPIGGAGGPGLHAIATVEQLAATAPGDSKKQAALKIMGEMSTVTIDPTASADSVDKSVKALNAISALEASPIPAAKT
jgi:hypothetical protein